MVEKSFLYKKLNYIYDLYSKKCIDYTYKKKKRNKKKKLTVVFIVQFIPAWNKFEPIYTAMNVDSRFNPVVLCVPINLSDLEKKKPGNIENPVYNFFMGQGYDAVNAISVDGKWRELKDLDPDYIFHTRPYDYLLPEPYKSRNSKYYALNCNVMYGAPVSTEFYDTVWNDSYFRNIFCYFSLDKNEMKDFESYFSKKNGRTGHRCFPFGATGLSNIMTYKDEHFEQIECKKRVLWSPRWSTDRKVGGSNFFRYQNWFFNISREYPNVIFTVRPHPLMFDNFVRTGEMTESEVEQFRTRCKNESNIILDESEDYVKTLWSTDILVSDISGIMVEYAITNKPLIYCTSEIEWNMVQSSQKLLSVNYIANNEIELYHIIKRLLDGHDDKKSSRVKMMDDMYGDVTLHNKKMLDCLWGLMNE